MMGSKVPSEAEIQERALAGIRFVVLGSISHPWLQICNSGLQKKSTKLPQSW